jgi:hypothetical protein
MVTCKVLADENCILRLLGSSCRNSACSLPISIKKTYIGATLSLQWQCQVGHRGTWSSSKCCPGKNGCPFFSNNLLVASSLFFSGNNYAKVTLLCQLLHLKFFSESTFHRLQISPTMSKHPTCDCKLLWYRDVARKYPCVVKHFLPPHYTFLVLCLGSYLDISQTAILFPPYQQLHTLVPSVGRPVH